ncbi:MAG TPA: hypothetical protein VNR60_09840 [Croceibacterium sp.]|nr:hypothetical protein [Croceibacterium sp.]
MTPQSRIRRIGWIAALAFCAVFYLVLHIKVHAVSSDVIRAERQIVSLERQKLLLETEFETRANQLQLAAWNNVEFGYTAPTAGQFLQNERRLADFGAPPLPGAPEPIRVAGATGDAPEYPRMVSPLTGKPIEEALLEPEHVDDRPLSGGLGAVRVPLRAVIASAAQ